MVMQCLDNCFTLKLKKELKFMIADKIKELRETNSMTQNEVAKGLASHAAV